MAIRTIYFTTFYYEKNIQRRQELIDCINKVSENKMISDVYVVNESKADVSELKNVNIIESESRATFNFMFKLINMVSNENDIVIIANTDIYPDAEAIKLLSFIKDNECYALARWDLQEDGTLVHLNRWDTADAWVFRSQLR